MNYLLSSLQEYFEEVIHIEGKLVTTESFLNERKKQLKTESSQNRTLISAITSYRDLSQLAPKENLYCPNFSYHLEVNGLDKEIEEIISQDCCLAVAQGYEAFESFLINILTEFLLNNPEKMVLLKILEVKLYLTKETIRGMLKKMQGVNNKGLLALVRKLSPHFKSYEIKNIHKVNISQWFDLISMVRHTLIHNRQIISPKLLEYLEKQRANEMFDGQFKRRKIGKHIRIYLEKNTATDILNWLNSYAHFIFKSLSVDNKFSLNVPEYIPQPLKY